MKNSGIGYLKMLYYFIVVFIPLRQYLIVFYTLAKGIYEDPNGNWHEIDRAFVVLIGVLAYELLIHFNVKNRILSSFFAYIPTLLLVLGYVWLSGFREPLAEGAYLDIFINFTMLFLLVSLIYNLSDIASRKKKDKEVSI